jgi:hypothetical protein
LLVDGASGGLMKGSVSREPAHERDALQEKRDQAPAALMVARAALCGSLFALLCWIPWAVGVTTEYGLPDGYLTLAREHSGWFLVASVAVGVLTFLIALPWELKRREPPRHSRRSLAEGIVVFAAYLVLPHALLFTALLSQAHRLAAAQIVILLAIDTWSFAVYVKHARTAPPIDEAARRDVAAS